MSVKPDTSILQALFSIHWQTYYSSTWLSSFNWWFIQSWLVKAFIFGIRLAREQILFLGLGWWGSWGRTWSRTLLFTFSGREEKRNNTGKILHVQQIQSFREDERHYSMFALSGTIQRTRKVNILWSLMAFGRLFHGLLSAAGLGIARISLMIMTAVTFMGAILFTTFNIQTKVHGVPLHFFSHILGNLKQNTMSWTDFGLAFMSYQSTQSQAGF